MEKYMRNFLHIQFNGEESDVFTLTTQQLQTLLERINQDAHQVLENRFLNWAVKEGIADVKQKKGDDRTFLAVLPDLGGMAVTSVTFLSRNPDKNWLVYGSSIKESIGPDENNEDWAEPDFTIRVKGYKLTAQGYPSQQDSEKCETYLHYWEGKKHTVFESPVQKDIREREEDMVEFRRELEEERKTIEEKKMTQVVADAFGEEALANWDKLTDAAKKNVAAAASSILGHPVVTQEGNELVVTHA